MLDLEAIKKREQSATPGPWFDCNNTIDDCHGVPFAKPFAGFSDDTWFQNKAFMVHARDDVPALIAEVERLEKRLRILQHERDQCVKNHVSLSEYAEKLEEAIKGLLVLNELAYCSHGAVHVAAKLIEE